MSSHIFSGFIILIIFASIFFYGAADVWTEAVIVAVIFVVSGLEIVRSRGDLGFADSRLKFLLLPPMLLAGYAIVQGLITAVYQRGGHVPPVWMPNSFNALAGIWVGIKIFAVVCFTHLLINHFANRIRLLVWSIMATGVFFAGLGVVRFLIQLRGEIGEFPLPALSSGIGFGTFVNQNHFAFLMLMTLGLIFAFAANSSSSGEKRFAWLAGGVFVWTALVLTGSRAGILSSFGVILTLFVLPVRNRFSNSRQSNSADAPGSFVKKTAVAVFVSFFLIVGIVWLGQDRVVRRFEKLPAQIETDSIGGSFKRIDVWSASIKMIGENPFYGVGFGGFKVAVSEYLDVVGDIVPYQAHNDYLELAASGGIIAVALTIWFLFEFFALVRHRFKKTSSLFPNVARVGALAGIVGVGIHSFFDFGLQMFGNLLFFSALVAIAVGVGDTDSKKIEETRNRKKSVAGIAHKSNRTHKKAAFICFYILTCFSLALFSIYFGISRLRLQQARNNSNDSVAFNLRTEVSSFPADADFYAAKADVSADENEQAAALQKAIAIRPNDYLLFLKMGQIEQLLGRDETAVKSFRQAVKLAPFYADPRLLLGNHLVRNGATQEGFEQLRTAYRQQPKYFEGVAKFAWTQSGESPEETIRLLSPEFPGETARLAEFLIEKDAAASAASLICVDYRALTAPEREQIVGELFTAGNFYSAFQINSGECNSAKRGTVEDGSFEKSEIKTGLGFGWRAVPLPDTVRLFADEDMASEGKKSLSVIFDGGYNSALPLLSQTICVEQRRRYRLSVAVRTSKLVTGGVPTLQIVAKGKDFKSELKEVKLPGRTDDEWNNLSIDFTTDERTEAVEIRVARQSCPQLPCPIFGRIWLDDVRLSLISDLDAR